MFEHEGELAGYVCISMLHEPSYDVIDGAWLAEGDNYAVVHRAMTADKSTAARGSRGTCSPWPSTWRRAWAKLRAGRYAQGQQGHEPPGKRSWGFSYCGRWTSVSWTGHDSRRNAYEKLI